MKKLFILFLFVFAFQELKSQSPSLSKVGYLSIEQIVSTVLNDDELKNKLYEQVDIANQKAENLHSEDENTKIETYPKGEAGIKKLLQKYIIASMLMVVRREGYTLILEKTETTILYADRNFDITETVLKHVKQFIEEVEEVKEVKEE